MNCVMIGLVKYKEKGMYLKAEKKLPVTGRYNLHG